MGKRGAGFLALLFSFMLASVLSAEHEGHDMAGMAKPPAEIKLGRYDGYLKLEGLHVKIALTADFYVESPENFREFPRLNAILKIILGGNSSHEYYTEKFEDLQYDYDYGNLTFDEPENDLSLTTRAEETATGTEIKGEVFIRSAGVSGTVFLKQESDEPPDDSSQLISEKADVTVDEKAYLPSLEGQYEGTCGKYPAAFQIQSVRGLRDANAKDRINAGFSHHYLFSGRIGFRKWSQCGVASGLCMYNNYGSIIYNPYLGKITAHARRGSDSCDVSGGQISCDLRVEDKTERCVFKKPSSPHKGPSLAIRRYNLKPGAEDLKPLPPASPPGNTDLSKAVGGLLSGYLHNETNDTYQVMTLRTVSYPSTDNPHNPNKLMITASAMLYFGDKASGDYVVQRFEKNSFYLRPGYTLQGPNSDAFLVISDWRKGFVRGTWYSRAFGRVGTIQLQKGALPSIPASANLVPRFSGEYENSSSSGGVSRWFKLLFPAQPSELTENLVRLTGTYQPVAGILSPNAIDVGSYDLYTGVLGWVISRGDTIATVSGRMSQKDRVDLYWPPAPNVFGAFVDEFRFEPFKRIRN